MQRWMKVENPYKSYVAENTFYFMNIYLLNKLIILKNNFMMKIKHFKFHIFQRLL